MKTLASILIILMSIVAIAPCSDANEIAVPQTEKSTDISKDIVHNIANDVHGQDENCSPLCPCQCCPSTDSFDIELSQASVIIPFPRPSVANVISPSDYSMIVWTPPQLIS
ncbi:MAG: hypothetical protein U5K69_11770 [Balneolaceae bacterium]|nr:hypothetical protein [Balneolaceae bacterium]